MDMANCKTKYLLIQELVKKCPNDRELGEKIRNIINKNKK